MAEELEAEAARRWRRDGLEFAGSADNAGVEAYEPARSSADALEGVNAFWERRPPDSRAYRLTMWDGVEQQLNLTVDNEARQPYADAAPYSEGRRDSRGPGRGSRRVTAIRRASPKGAGPSRKYPAHRCSRPVAGLGGLSEAAGPASKT